MKKQSIIILLAILLLASFGFVSLLAQESETKNAPVTTESQETTTIATESQQTSPLTEPQKTLPVTELEVQWLWGEVVSVDILNKQMIVKYLDYEIDTESQISINIDDKTTFENVKSLEEIKTQDTVSVDYIVNPEGKNITKNISVEKNEDIQALPEETTKEEPKVTPGLE